MKEKRKLKSWQVGLVACIITAILFFIMLTITNNNPLFGGLSYAGDLPDQYLSFFQYWRHLLLGNLSGFSYSFSNGLGGNMLGNISYYLMSPLNFIILLFPGSKINIAVYLIIWIKLSLASFTFSWVISKFFKFQYQSYAVFLGVAYGLSAYCMIYFANLMWLDSVILLPLIIYFLQKLLIGKSPVLYILLLALDLIFNYYTAYMVCIFVVITFIAYTIIYFDGWKKWCKQAFNFAISSILSGMISGFVLLPTFLNLRANKLTQTEINQNFHLDSIATIKSVSSKLFIGDLSSNLPALFIGTLALITFILFFVDSRNSLKEKLVNLGIALIFIVSFMYTRPYLLWHGGQNPVSFPYRFVFIVVFWMLLLAAKELSNLPKKKNSILITGLIVLLLALFASFIRYKFDLLSKATWIALILIPLFILLLLYSRNRRIRIILLGIATIEIVVSGYYELESMGVRVGNTYSSYIIENQKVFDKIPKKYKTQRIARNYFLNNDRSESYTFNYRGAENFSSNNNPKLSEFYNYLGLPSYGYYYFYKTGTKARDALFGIKAFVNNTKSTQSGTMPYITYGSRADLDKNPQLFHKDTITVYKTEAFPIGFSGNLANNMKLSPDDPIDNQNLVLNSLTGTKKNIFTYGQLPTINSNNLHINRNKQVVQLTRKNKKTSGQLTLTYNLKPHKTGYLLLQGNMQPFVNILKNYQTYITNKTYGPSIRIKLNGQDINTIPGGYQPLGFKANKLGKVKLIITLTSKANTATFVLPRVIKINQQNLENKIKITQANGWKLKKFKDTYLAGTVNIKKGQALVTTIPYDSNWQAYVDGKQVPVTKSINKLFLAIKMQPGKHQVALKYKAHGLSLGVLLTIVGIILMIIYGNTFIKKQDERNKND